jgi:hypothetical protein
MRTEAGQAAFEQDLRLALDAVLSSQTMDSVVEADKETVRQAADQIIPRLGSARTRDARRSSRYGLLFAVFVLVAFFFGQWKASVALWDSAAFTDVLFGSIFLWLAIISGVGTFGLFRPESKLVIGVPTPTGAKALAILVLGVGITIFLVLESFDRLPGRLLGALLCLAVFAVTIFLVIMVVLLAEFLQLHLFPNTRVDPRDRLFGALVVLLAFIEGVRYDPEFILTLPDEIRWEISTDREAVTWPDNHAARRTLGAIFEREARAIEDAFHTIAPLYQGAARAAARESGARIAATLRSHGSALLIGSAASDGISSRLAEALVAAGRGEWAKIGIEEPPAVATRIARRYGGRVFVATLLAAAGVFGHWAIGAQLAEVFPHFRTIMVIAAVLALTASPKDVIQKVTQLGDR